MEKRKWGTGIVGREIATSRLLKQLVKLRMARLYERTKERPRRNYPGQRGTSTAKTNKTERNRGRQRK